jgi:predicted GTPase
MDGTSDSKPQRRVIILGAAGRDYHMFNTVYRPENDRDEKRPASGDGGADRAADPAAAPPHQNKDLVVAFTHAQIPHITSASYPTSLSGYPNPIPIYLEKDLERAIVETRADACVFAYSDVSWQAIGALANRVRAAGADFILPSAGTGSPNDPSTLCPRFRKSLPVVSVTAVRTGCGKSQVCALVADAARKHGLRVALVRHPMPYGDLEKMRVQRFAALKDLDEQDATVEEREEYEQHLRRGVVVFAGVDYRGILNAVEREGDGSAFQIVLFDGGNNDTPFYSSASGVPSLDICVCDPFRPNAHADYFPGGINFSRAQHLVVNKCNTAPRSGVEEVLKAAAEINPSARVYITASRVTLLPPTENEEALRLVRGKRALCVDDGPTITHGGMPTGAAVVAAREAGAEVVDPRPFFCGALAEALQKYSHIGLTVPALGYGSEQVHDLAETLRAAVKETGAEVVVIGTPTDLEGVLKGAGHGGWAGAVPVVRASYAVEDMAWEEEGKPSRSEGGLAAMLDGWMAERRREKDEADAAAPAR